MPNITLDRESHTYRDETGRVIHPSATGLLRWAGLIDDTWFNEYAARRGTLVHLVCQLHNEGDLDETTVDPVLQPYFMAYVRFLTDTGFQVVRGEFIAYNEGLDIVCMPDLEGIFPGDSTFSVGDIKTGVLQPWAAYQTMFQRLAIGKFRKRFGLELKATGKYRVHWFNDRKDEAVIRELLHNYRQEVANG